MLRAALVLLACLGATGGAFAQSREREPAPVVVELFTSQGCAACPEANAFVHGLSSRDDVLALTFSVDYWDYLGWRDTFARPEFTARQRAYMERLRLRQMYTPQVVVDGADHAPGFEHEDIQRLVQQNVGPANATVDMLLSEDADLVWVGSGRRPRGGADVWLVRYAPGEQSVEVRRGENRGQTVRVGNVVREVVRLGGWRGRPMRFRLPAASSDGLKTAVILQGARGGPIIGAARD